MKILILSLCRALMAGESLTDPAVWKNRQLRGNALMTIAAVASPLFPMLGLMPDDVLTILQGGAIFISGLLNAYLTIATTTKIGLGCSKGES